MIMRTPHLTTGYDPTLTAQIAKTRPGMAHWAASDPPGEICANCVHLGYQREVHGVKIKMRRYGGCAKFLKLVGRHGPRVPACCEACRHFEPRDDDTHRGE